MSDELDDDRLVEQIRGGDRQALARYAQRRQPQLLAFIERNMSDKLRAKVEAQDILQETIVAALDSLRGGALGDRDPFSWLCQGAERRIVDAYRRLFAAQKRAGEHEVPLQAAGGNDQGQLIEVLVNSMTSPSAAFSRNQREARMLQAISVLPPESQDAIRMRYVEGLPTKTIAQRLGKTDGSVRVLLSRALRRLESCLRDDTWCGPSE